MLTLHLSTIRTPQEHFEQVYQPKALAAALASGDEAFTLVAPVELTFDVEKGDDHFRLVGQVRTTVELSCSRCLEPLTWTVDAPFDLQYRPYGQQAGGDEREIEADDFSTAFYEHDQIDLGQLIRERLYLSVPMKPLCTSDCRGLCAVCGTNLNR